MLQNWRNQGYYLNYGEDCIRNFIRKERNRSISKGLDIDISKFEVFSINAPVTFCLINKVLFEGACMTH